jgi:hypothetical protein
MNRPLPPGDRGYREGDPSRQPRPSGVVSWAIGLVCGIENPSERATPPGSHPAALGSPHLLMEVI